MLIAGTEIASLLADATETSRSCGMLFAILLLFAGILKCLQIIRRPTTNTLCVLSLTLVLIAWVGFSILGNAIAPKVAQSDQSPRIFMIVGWMVLFCMVVTAFVLGIIGLVDYQQHKDEYRQGRHQAVWGILLSSGFIALCGFGLVRNVLARTEKAPPQIATEPGEVFEFEKYNFSFRAPEKPWVRLDVKTINPDATLGFSRRDPELFFFIIAEQAGVESNMAAEGLAAVAEAHLRQGGEQAAIGEKREETVAGVAGLRFTSSVTTSGRMMSFSHWVAIHNGYAWQFIVAGPASAEAEVQRAGRKLVRRFELLEPERTFHAATRSAQDVKAPQFGYELRLADSGWHEWTEMHDNFPAAHSGALRGLTHVFSVVPLRLGGLSPTDAELATAMLATIGMMYPQDVDAKRPFALGDLKGHVFDCTRQVEDKNFVYRLHVIRNNDFAYLLAGWHLAMAGVDTAPLDEIVQRFAYVGTDDPTSELSPPERETQSLLFANLGDAVFNAGQFVRAVEYYRQAFSYNPDNEDLLNAVADVYSRLGRNQAALSFLEEHIARFPKSQLSHANQAYQLACLGKPEQAVAIYERAFADGFDDEGFFDNYIEQLEALNRFDDAHAAVDAALARGGSRHYQLWKARLYGDQQEHEKAIELLREMEANSGFDAIATSLLIENYLGALEYADGRAACERAIENGYNSAYLHWLKGQCELGLKRYPEAKTSFENAARLDPTDEEIRRYLAYVSGLLGEGDNSNIKEPLDPVQLPASVAARVEAASTTMPELSENESGAWIPIHVEGIEFEEDGTRRQTQQVVIHVNTRQAVSDFNTLTFDFDPLTEQIFVNWLTVKDADGNTVATGDVNTYYVVDDTSGSMVTQDRILHVPVPGLAPGLIVDYAVTVLRSTATERWSFEEEIFAHGCPVGYHAVFARGDVANLAYDASDNITVEQEPNCVIWSVTNQPIYRWKWRAPRYDRWLPTVAFADKRATWDTEVTEYLESLRDHLELDDETRALAARLTAQLATDDEKLAALVRHVQSEYTYRAIEFGRRAAVPNTTDFITRSRYGDCKDHALLLRQLLTAAGFRANLALISTTHGIRPTLASLDQFDHMIVHVDVPDGDRFIDCTDKYADLTGPLPYTLASKQILVLDADNPRFIETGACAATVVRCDRRIELAGGTHASVDEHLTLSGDCATRMRTFLSIWNQNDQRAAIQDLLVPFKVTRLDTLEIENIEALDQPITLHATYTVRDAFHKTPDGLVGRLPAPWESYYLREDADDARQCPFELEVPLRLESKAVFVIPAQFELTDPADSANQDESALFSWNIATHRTAEGLELVSQVDRKTGVLPAEQYTDHYKASEELVDVLAAKVAIADKQTETP